MMFELEVDRVFRAEHSLVMYDGQPEPMHAHDWQTVVVVGATELDRIEVVMDFHELERIIDGAIEPLDGVSLNDLSIFASCNPSAERVAEHLGRTIAAGLPESVHLVRVTVTEAPGCRATWRGGDKVLSPES